MATSGHNPRWFFYADTNRWVPYDSHSNSAIEDAFQSGNNQIIISARKNTYTVDLLLMKQTNNFYGTKRNILRDDTGTVPLPNHLVPVPYGTIISSGTAFPPHIPVSMDPHGATLIFASAPHSATFVPPKSGSTGGTPLSPLGGHTSPTTPLPLTGTKPVPSPRDYGATFTHSMSTISPPTTATNNPMKSGTKSGVPSTPAPVSADTSPPSMPRKKYKSEPSKKFGFYDKFFRKYTEMKSPESIPKDESCPICITSLLEPADIDVPTKSHSSSLPLDVVCGLKKCSHLFHVVCIGTMLDSMSNMKRNEYSISCPICQTIHGIKTGDQPVTGTMNVRLEYYSVPGYEGYQTNVIGYHFSDGISETGTIYNAAGFPRDCYVPDCPEGRVVIELLKIAWKRRLIFTIGTSVTTGHQNRIVWNNIHHKTEPHSNTSGHGFPDPNFLKNIKMELAVQGVTEDEL